MLMRHTEITELQSLAQQLVSEGKYNNDWLWCANCYRCYQALDCRIAQYKGRHYFACAYPDCPASLDKSGEAYTKVQAAYAHFPAIPVRHLFYTEHPKLTNPENWRQCSMCYRCYTIDVHTARIAQQLQPQCPFEGCEGNLLHSKRWSEVVAKHPDFPTVPQHWSRYVTEVRSDFSPGAWYLGVIG